ncbi:MAG: signal peptidase I [Psittacicella sp.]
MLLNQLNKYKSIILLVLAYILLHVLNSFRVPNAFTLTLLVLTLVSGVAYFFGKRNKNKEGKKSKDGIGSLFIIFLVIFILRSFFYEPFYIPSTSMEPNLLPGDLILVNKFEYGIKNPITQNPWAKFNSPKAGDVIVFKAPYLALKDAGMIPQNYKAPNNKMSNIDFIKRVVGVGGDTVIYNNVNATLEVISKGKTHIYTYTNVHLNPNFLYRGEDQTEETENGAISHNILLNPSNYRNQYIVQYYFKQKSEPLETWVVPKGEYFVMGDNRDNSDDSRYWGFVPYKNIVGKATVIWFSLKQKEGNFPIGVRFSRIFTKIK